jgi:S1-C subfamily serine protease
MVLGKSILLVLLAAASAAAQEARPAPPPANEPAVANDRARPTLLEQLDAEVRGIAEKIRPSIVQVIVHRSVEVEGGGIEHETVATSGAVWSADGSIVSLGRAFESADGIEVALASGARVAADLVGTDDETGLALLRVDAAALPAPLRPVPLGSSKGLGAGSLVVAVTNPFGLSGSCALGTIAGRDRVVRRGRLALTDVLQITTPVNPGDPGGVLADARGEVVGIVASTYDRPLLDADAVRRVYEEIMRFGEDMLGQRAPEALRRALHQALASQRAREASGGERPTSFAGSGTPFGGQGIGFAIPIDQARAVVERLRSAGKVERGWVGVQVVALDPWVKAQLQIAAERGVLIVGVKEGSPAEKAGLRQYDIVVRYGGREVSDLREFRRMVLDSPPGRGVAIEILRKGERASLEIVPLARQLGGGQQGQERPVRGR